MNAIPKGTLYKQARRQAIWAAVWLVLAIAAMLVRPEADGVRQWLNDQAMLLAGLLMVFQFGRMFQCLTNIRLTPASGMVPAWASLEADTETAARSSEDGYHFQVRDIRAFASVDEAKEHGWEFAEPIAHFGGEPVPRTAQFNGLSYVYDGLSPERMRGSVPQNQRLFGKLLYKLAEPEPSTPPAPPMPLVAS